MCVFWLDDWQLAFSLAYFPFLRGSWGWIVGLISNISLTIFASMCNSVLVRPILLLHYSRNSLHVSPICNLLTVSNRALSVGANWMVQCPGW